MFLIFNIIASNFFVVSWVNFTLDVHKFAHLESYTAHAKDYFHFIWTGDKS